MEVAQEIGLTRHEALRIDPGATGNHLQVRDEDSLHQALSQSRVQTQAENIKACKPATDKAALPGSWRSCELTIR